MDGLQWTAGLIQHTVSNTGHGRLKSRSIKTVEIDENLGGIAFPHARLALRVHRRRKETGKKETRETVYAVTSLDAHQANIAKTTRAIRDNPERTLPLLGITNNPTLSGT